MLGLIERNTTGTPGRLTRRSATTALNASQTSAGERPAAMSLPPAETTTTRGLAGAASRPAKPASSSSRQPPTPRLTIVSPGKSCSSVFQSRTFEDPRRQTPPGGGGVSRSAAANLSSSSVHRTGGGTAGAAAGPPAAAEVVGGADDGGGSTGVAAAAGGRVLASGFANTRFQSREMRTTCQP